MDADLQYLGNHAATTALLDGKVDVAVGLATITNDQSVVFPAGPRAQARRDGPGVLQHPDPERRDRKGECDAERALRCPPPGAQPGAQSAEEFDCLGDFVFMASHPKFPDELAYEITKVYLDIDDEAGKYLGGGKLYRRASMCIVPKGIQAHPASLQGLQGLRHRADDSGIGAQPAAGGRRVRATGAPPTAPFESSRHS